jgi:hypothetical protein
VNTRVGFVVQRPRAPALVAALAVTIVLTLGVGVPSNSAGGSQSAASSAFCKTILSFHGTPPSTLSGTNAYKQWLNTYLPFYEKLASQAPSPPVHRILTQIVTIMKSERSAPNSRVLQQYLRSNLKQWSTDWTTYVKADLACEMAKYG